MPRIIIAQLAPRSARLSGGIVGEEHARQVAGTLEQGLPDDDILLLDFAGIESASASYLKRMLNPFLIEVADAGENRPRRVVPLLTNVSARDLREDLSDYLEGKKKVLIETEDCGGRLQYAGILGQLDGAACETFELLRRLKRVTAQQLYELYPDRTSNQTAWNNRLAQLVDLRIAKRTREGRFWIYQTTVTT